MKARTRAVVKELGGHSLGVERGCLWLSSLQEVQTRSCASKAMGGPGVTDSGWTQEAHFHPALFS